MTDALESLPEDGASYPCCFVFGGWECPDTATAALTQAAYKMTRAWLVNHEKSPIVLRGRAICNKHFRVLLETVGD